MAKKNHLEISKDKKTALLTGAHGLVGTHCLKLLLEHEAYEKVIAIVDKPLKLKHEKLITHVFEFEQIDQQEFENEVDDVYCCIGRTFLKDENKYIVQLAKKALENGANQFLLLSTAGASASSLVFYLRVLGELELVIKKLPYWGIHIFQPALLIGEKVQNRWGEGAANFIRSRADKLLGGFLSKYRPIEAEIVAQSMVDGAQKFKEGIFIYESNYLQDIADEEQKKLTN